MPPTVSEKKQAEDLEATALPSALINSGELRYFVALFELPISCHRVPRLPGITPQRGCTEFF